MLIALIIINAVLAYTLYKLYKQHFKSRMTLLKIDNRTLYEGHINYTPGITQDGDILNVNYNNLSSNIKQIYSKDMAYSFYYK